MLHKKFLLFPIFNACGRIQYFPGIPLQFCIVICTIKTGQSTSNIAYEWLPGGGWGLNGKTDRPFSAWKTDAFNTWLWPEIKTIKCLSRYLFDSINLSMATGKSVPACQCTTIFQRDIALGDFLFSTSAFWSLQHDSNPIGWNCSSDFVL